MMLIVSNFVVKEASRVRSFPARSLREKRLYILSVGRTAVKRHLFLPTADNYQKGIFQDCNGGAQCTMPLACVKVAALVP